MDKAPATNATVAVELPEEEEEVPDSFTCCVCLDLLYKPIVLSCGHISCFWCVHHSMGGLKSRCPICRHPYNHFPTICQMLHFLLLKMYPITYKRREEQILEEERKSSLFSPEFDCSAFGSHADQEYDLKDHEHSSTTNLGSNSSPELCSTRKGEYNGNCKQVSISDVQCTACKLLLFHPVILNCGHVYCETCIVDPVNEMLKCQACESLHPTGHPKVCLELDHFVEEQFPREYALRRDAIQHKQAQIKIENLETCSTKASKKDSLFWSMLKGERLPQGTNRKLKIHLGVGCDHCGMYPIIGDRYRCKDCVEESGFDLCGNCYRTPSKQPGRFNQRHTPEHKFERQKAMVLKLVGEASGDVSFSLVDPDDSSEVPENELPASSLSGDAQESLANSSAFDIWMESADDQNETESSS